MAHRLVVVSQHVARKAEHISFGVFNIFSEQRDTRVVGQPVVQQVALAHDGVFALAKDLNVPEIADFTPIGTLFPLSGRGQISLPAQNNTVRSGRPWILFIVNGYSSNRVTVQRSPAPPSGSSLIYKGNGL